MKTLGPATPNPKRLEVSDVNRIVELIKKVNCSTWAIISEVASEMGIKKTTLMQFVQDNPKNFDIVEATSRSARGVVKTLGLAIRKVYLTAEENPVTEEWLTKMKEEWADKIQVFEMSYYNQHEFWYLGVDTETNRRNQWRNTPEKIQTLIDAGVIKMVETGYGGFGDYYNWEGLLLTPEAREAITSLGWNLIYPEEQ